MSAAHGFRLILAATCGGGMLLGGILSGLAAESPDSETQNLARVQAKLFESEIRPLLASKCFGCHGEKKQNGGLRLDTRAGFLAGGDTAPAVVPGKIQESLLVEAINYESLEMPPKGKLAPEEIALLTRWVEAGAFWPDEGDQPPVRANESDTLTEADRNYWAFRTPVTADPPEAQDAEWCKTEMDRFLLAALEDAGLTPGIEADRVTLLRRVTQDVTGLPPTPEETDAFLSDTSPKAYEAVVDRLLQSPRYGERQAQLWLDLVRYAESDGYKQDTYRPTAWRYRDYVIRSFNEDKPYDQFVVEQIAGDELDPTNPEALIATGFYRQGIYEYNQRDVRGQWRDILDDVTDTVGDVFLSMSVGCARCHDHKFDPILQKDYYRLRAFFAGLSFVDGPAATQQETSDYNTQFAVWQNEAADVRARIDDFTRERYSNLEKAAISKFAPELQEVWHCPVEQRTAEQHQTAYLMQRQIDEEITNYPRTLKKEAKAEWDALQSELSQFDSRKPADLPQASRISEFGPVAPATMIPDKPRLGEIAPGFLSVLDEAPADISPASADATSSGRRTALAKWLTRPDNPLTARIIVNRIWKMHFGQGLVTTPSDFGSLSEPPSHPELLDWLAVKFIENGWSLKWLHRELLLSAAYRQSSQVNSADERVVQASSIDPRNRLLWRFPIQRLTGEQVRDAVLAASGELDLRAGGEGTEVAEGRRSIYTKVIRNRRDPLLEVFDFPERIETVADRHVTTTAVQSLFLINGDWSLDRARHFAKRVSEGVAGGEDSKVRYAYRLAFGRDASLAEIDRGVNFLYASRNEDATNQDAEAPSQGLVDLCHVILNANEFLYLD